MKYIIKKKFFIIIVFILLFKFIVIIILSCKNNTIIGNLQRFFDGLKRCISWLWSLGHLTILIGVSLLGLFLFLQTPVSWWIDLVHWRLFVNTKELLGGLRICVCHCSFIICVWININFFLFLYWLKFKFRFWMSLLDWGKGNILSWLHWFRRFWRLRDRFLAKVINCLFCCSFSSSIGSIKECFFSQFDHSSLLLFPV